MIPLHRLLASGRADDHPVCHDAQRVVAWREFSRRVAARAAHFAGRNEARWLLSGGDPLDFAVSLLALLHSGKQEVIPPNTQAGTLAQLADAFDARADQAPADDAGARSRLIPIDATTAIIDLYTSGSTGDPKRVRKTLAQFDAEVAVLERLWGAALGRAAIVATAPHQHIYGLLFRVLWPLAAGRAFDNATCADPDTLAERLALLRDTALVSSPAQLARLPELLPLAALRPAPKIIFSSGGPLPATAAAHFQRQLGRAPIEVFGSTETGGIAWRQQDGRAASEAWTPLPGIAVDREFDGALSLRSPFLADDAPLRLDDAIELFPGGRFRLCGRLDRIVKIEEKRLSLPDMEAQLLSHRAVNRAALVALPALPGKRQSVGAVLVLSEEGRQQLAATGRRDTVQGLRRHLAAHFEAVLLPRRWRFAEALPIDERGKLTRDALLELFAEPAPPAAPPASLQAQVLAVRESPGVPHRVVIDLVVTRQLVHFAGHFPDLPIVPGVVQIDWAIAHARRHLPLRGQFTALENIKFLALVLPDARLELTLAWDDENARLDFVFASSERRCSSGRIVFGAAA